VVNAYSESDGNLLHFSELVRNKRNQTELGYSFNIIMLLFPCTLI